MFKKLFVSLVAFAGMSLGLAQAQTAVHTPTLEGTYTWTGTDTWTFGNLKFAGSIPQCPTGQAVGGLQADFTPNCVPSQTTFTAGFNNTVGAGGLSSSATTLTLTSSTSGYPTHGCGYIDVEYMCYVSLDVDGVTLDGVTRGLYGTTAVSHGSGAVWQSVVAIFSGPGVSPNAVIFGGVPGSIDLLSINNPFKDNLNPVPSIVANQGGAEWWVGQSDGQIHEHNITSCCNALGPVQIGQGDAIPHNQDFILNSHNVMQITQQYETQQPLGLGGGIAGGVSFAQPATIAAPTLLNGNPTGAVTYSYRCQDHAGLVPGTDVTFTAAASPPFPFTIICPRQAGVATYDMVRTAGGVNQGIIQANVLPGTGFNDNVNASATATTVITSNTSKAFIDGLNYIKAGDLYDLNLSVSSAPLCVGAGNILTTTGCSGGGGGASPASPVGSIQTNADGTNLGALNANGIIKQTGTTPGTANGTTNSTAGDFALPFDVTISGTGVTGSFNSGHLIITGSGAAGSGTVAPGLAHQFAYYPTAGTGVQGAPSNSLPGYFVIDPSMSLANINTLLSTAPTGSTVLVLNGTPQYAWSNPNHLRMIDTRTSADYAQIYQYGIGCDAAQWTVPLVAGSNVVNVGADFGTEAIGRTFSFGGRTGYGFGSEQWAWAPTIVSYSFPNATLSGNAPFTGSFKGTLGTLNTTNIQAALDTSGFSFPLTIPSGCRMLTGPLNINHATSIVGRQMQTSGFIDLPGQDIIVQPSGGHGAAGNGMRWENFGFVMQADVDWSLGYNQYPVNYTSGGTGVTAVAPVYRPAGNRGHEANNVLADNWVTGGSNGVASTTQNTAVVCVPTALGRTFTNGNIIVFPYFTPGVFSTTILNQTGAGCTSATGLTLNATLPNNAAYTVAQAYYVTGSAIQTNQTAIPTTMTYPQTVTISLPNGPSPFGIYDFAPTGHVFMCSSQFDYLGINYNNTPGSATITLRKGPSTTPGYAVGQCPIIPANPCPAKFNTPPPVIPNLNGGSDSTPSGAVDFPGHCVGASAIAFPQPDGLSADTGMVNSFLTNLEFDTLDVQNQNNVAAMIFEGNTGPYGVTFSGEKVNFLEYGMVEGPAAINNFHISSVGPTATGNHIQDWQVHAAFPFILSDFQQSSIERVDSYTAAVNPYDGTFTGSGNCESLLNTLNEQTGALVTITGQLSQHAHNCEPAGSGSGAVIYAYADIQPFGMEIGGQENFEAGPAFFGGSGINWNDGQISVPAFNYGTNNHFQNASVNSSAFPTNQWLGFGSNQFFNWGKLSSCSMYYGGSGPLVSCGALWNQGFEGKSMDSARDGRYATPYMNILGGQVKPGMWNANGSFDSAPMSVGFALDPTEPYWGVYTACNLNTSNQCQPNHFFGNNGLMWIGGNSPFLAAIPYDLEFNVKSAAASGSFTVLIQVFDGGAGLCASPGTIASQSFSTTTSWAHKHMRVDLSNRTGCFFSPQFYQSSTTDQYRIGQFDLVPVPSSIRAPVVSDSIEGTSCSALPEPASPGAYLGSSTAFVYYCNSAGTVMRVGIS